jgi:superfamily II DNA or RNA helicase
MIELIERDIKAGKKVVLYTNRRLLLEQIAGVLESHSIPFGVRAAGHEQDQLQPVQLSSVQTEVQRVYKSKKWQLFPADTVLVDECHNQAGNTSVTLLRDHQRRGGHLIGFTATPLDIGHIYTDLVVAGTNSELRECGAHVICHTFAPDEPDTKGLKKQATGEYTENDVRKVIMTPVIFGRVYEWWKKLNPDARPAILFGPGVGESLWFAEQFYVNGVSAAHIDGDTIWVNGETMKSSQETREDVLDAVRSGEIKVLCNRFVLREGIDIPELYHCILATCFGSLKSYLQSGGRLLRAHPSLDHVICQDHGGNWHRHGDLNEDREWELQQTSYITSELREQAMREEKQEEPLVCPKCMGYRLWGDQCPYCGYRHSTRTRMVIQKDGKLKSMAGRIYKPRRVRMASNTEKLWTRCLHRCRRSGMTFRQAEGLFFYENHYYPPNTLPGMPIASIDWFMPIKEVPQSRCYVAEQPPPETTLF